MADAPVVHIGENSPEYTAFRLLHAVAYSEGMKLLNGTGEKPANRKWILDTYAERAGPGCLNNFSALIKWSVCRG